MQLIILLKQFFFNVVIFTLFYLLLSFDSLSDIEFYKNYFRSVKILIIVTASVLDIILKQKRKEGITWSLPEQMNQYERLFGKCCTKGYRSTLYLVKF